MKLFRKDTNELVELPAKLDNHRGEPETVLSIAQDSREGSEGKVLVDGGDFHRTLYPGVFGCYIADAPREEVPS